MSQKSEEFETPERSDIRGIMEDHIVEMEASDSDDVWIKSGMHHLLLTMKGRRSGRDVTVALPFWNDANGLPKRSIVKMAMKILGISRRPEITRLMRISS